MNQETFPVITAQMDPDFRNFCLIGCFLLLVFAVLASAADKEKERLQRERLNEEKSTKWVVRELAPEHYVLEAAKAIEQPQAEVVYVQPYELITEFVKRKNDDLADDEKPKRYMTISDDGELVEMEE